MEMNGGSLPSGEEMEAIVAVALKDHAPEVQSYIQTRTPASFELMTLHDLLILNVHTKHAILMSG